MQVRAAERGEQHGEVKGLGTFGAVHEFVVRQTRVDVIDVRRQYGFHSALFEDGFGEGLAGDHFALVPEVHSVHAEVSKVFFVGDVDDLG